MAKIINELQGTPGWHAHRASHFNASDAPAMMGVSRYKSRGDLLRENKTGLAADVDGATQKRFDQGHEYEAIARPWAEAIIGEELYPVVLADEIDGMPLSASLDGLTMDDSTSWEHKTLNDKLRQCLDNGDPLPEQYRIQMEQGFLLSGARRCLFMASAGDCDDKRHCWYEHDPELQQRIIAGWHQFAADLESYAPPAAEKVVTGSAPPALPALRIELSGAVSESNLDEFRKHAIAVFGAINSDLQTDEDFADAEATVKWLKDVEKRLSAAKDHALSQTADIDRLFKTIDELGELARTKRLDLDKQNKALKEARKRDIYERASDDLATHVWGIEEELTKLGGSNIKMPSLGADIAGPMKGKRTIATLRDAADTAVANAKIEADRLARDIRANLELLKTEAADHETLFPDGGRLAASQSADDLRHTIKARIAEHQEQERRRAEQKAQAERRQAEQRAAAERQQTARATPEPETKPAPETATPRAAPSRPKRPGDDQIIACVAREFAVDHDTARGWIADITQAGGQAA